MATAYLDTNSGIAGDMMLSALVDAGLDPDQLQSKIDSLGLPELKLVFRETQRHCFRALHLDVQTPPEHAHRHLSEIQSLIANSALNDREKHLANRLFQNLARAEAKVHGSTMEEVHFHEVGAVDSIVDIVGTAVGICSLNIDRVIASPTPTGCGQIKIAHGIVSVPAPATAELLRGIPIRESHIESELTTPTGAAILATLADGFGPVPDMQISRIGYGAGTKDFAEQANILRILVGEPVASSGDRVTVLETNLDDVSGEQIGFAVEQIWQAGALDVFTTPIAMKKNRPASMLSVICHPERRISIEDCMFTHCGTLGIRRTIMDRSTLERQSISVQTGFGNVRVKIAWSAQHPLVKQFAPEYEDCRQCAIQHGTTISAVYREAIRLAETEARTRSNPQEAGDMPLYTSESGRQSQPTASQHEHSAHDHSHDHGHDHHHH